MISCKDVALELTESLDTTISLPRRIRLRLHLAICKECQRLRGQLILLREAAKRVDTDPSAQSIGPNTRVMSPEFRQKLSQMVNTAANEPDKH